MSSCNGCKKNLGFFSTAYYCPSCFSLEEERRNKSEKQATRIEEQDRERKEALSREALRKRAVAMNALAVEARRMGLTPSRTKILHIEIDSIVDGLQVSGAPDISQLSEHLASG